jgi:hypothetical protein
MLRVLLYGTVRITNGETPDLSCYKMILPAAAKFELVHDVHRLPTGAAVHVVAAWQLPTARLVPSWYHRLSCWGFREAQGESKLSARAWC